MKSQTKGYPALFQANFDRDKLAFLDLANRGDGLTPINYIFSTEGAFEFINANNIIVGTIEVGTVYNNLLYASTFVNTPVIQLTDANSANYVGFQAGSLTANTIWTLPLQDGATGEILSTDGNAVLSWITQGGGGGGAPIGANYVLNNYTSPRSLLPNAQALDVLYTNIPLDANILKINSAGVVEIASGGGTPFVNDYVTPGVFQAEVKTIEGEIAELTGVTGAVTVAIAIALAELNLINFVTISPTINPAFIANQWVDLANPVYVDGPGFLYSSASGDPFTAIATFDMVRSVTLTAKSSALTANVNRSVTNNRISFDFTIDASGPLKQLSAMSTQGIVIAANTPSIYTTTLTPSGLTSIGFAVINGKNSYNYTLEASSQLNNNATLIFPATTGSPGQVLATDGGIATANTATTYWVNNGGGSSTTGFATLNGINGVMINTTMITTNSIVTVTRNIGQDTLLDVTTIGNLLVGSISANTSFRIYSTVATDIGRVDWVITNP